MTREFWEAYFLQFCFMEWDRIIDHPSTIPGKHVMEFRFVRIEGVYIPILEMSAHEVMLTLRTCSKAECVSWESTRIRSSKGLFAHGTPRILADFDG